MQKLLLVFAASLIYVSNAYAAESVNTITSPRAIDGSLRIPQSQTLEIDNAGSVVIGAGAATKETNPAVAPSNASALSSKYYSLPGERRVYYRPLYDKSGNLAVNSDFSSGTFGWMLPNLSDKGGKPLYSVVRHGGKSWLRINQELQTDTGKQGLVAQTIDIPESLRNGVIEVSFLVSGFFTGFRIPGDGTDFVFNTRIDPRYPERIYYYYHPNGASTFTLMFLKGWPGMSVPGESFEVTEIAVREAAWRYESIGKGLPASGGTLHFARWISAWDENAQKKQLANIRKMGGMVRVWLSSELLGTYVNKANPVKRKSPHLTPQYTSATTAKVFTGLDPAKLQRLDWFFEAARQQGLKVVITLFGGYTDSAGNPHAKMSLPLSLEFLDTDPDVRAGFNTLASAIVTRYAKYENIVGWELVNEGWGTWRGNYSGYAPAADFNNDRPLSFAGYRAWERSAYAAVKAADPKRPVILNSGDSDTLYLLGTDSVCDWSAVSEYLGAIRIANFSGTPTRFYVFSKKTNSLANGTPLKVHTTGSFPSGIDGTTVYYVVNVSQDSFELAKTPGGAGLDTNGGSGRLYFYSTDGTSLAAFDNVFQRWADFPKMEMFAEMGAPVEVGRLLYRDDTYEAVYLREGFNRLGRFGFTSGIVYDEFPAFKILWDANYNLNQSGKVTATFGATGKTN